MTKEVTAFWKIGMLIVELNSDRGRVIAYSQTKDTGLVLTDKQGASRIKRRALALSRSNLCRGAVFRP